MKRAVEIIAIVLVLLATVLHVRAAAQAHEPVSAKIVSAKSVYLDNETGFEAVGVAAVTELKKWGRYKVITRRDKADLVFVLSAEPYDYPDPANKRQDGNFEGDPIRIHHRPARAYLTIAEPSTGEELWTDSRQWGGLLTGFNSAGRRLIVNLRKKMEK